MTNSQSIKLKDKKSNLTKDQWEKALKVFLLGEEAREKNDSFLEDVELIAKVEEGVSTTIVIRKKVEGITVRHMNPHIVMALLTTILAKPGLSCPTRRRK